MLARGLIVVLVAIVLAGCGGSPAGSVLYQQPGIDEQSQAPPADDGSGLRLMVLKGPSGAPSGVRVTWDRETAPGVKGYYVYRADDSDGDGSDDLPDGDPAGYSDYRRNGGDMVSQPGSGDSVTFDDQFSPDVGDTFYYRVTVVNATDDESDFSNQESVTIAQHTVTSITTTPVSIGDEVTIDGTYFGQTQGSDKVYFTDIGGSTGVEVESGDYVSWGPTQIKVKVPYGAADGPVGVEVDGVQVDSGDDVSYNEPTLTSLDPTKDWVDHDYITLSGDDFGPADKLGSGTSVYFGGTEATDYDTANCDDETIEVKVPTSATGLTVDVYVSVAGNESGTQSFTILPHIDSLSSAEGNTGDEITLSGTNFGDDQGTGTVTVNGKDASVSSWSNTSVTITIPVESLDGDVVLTRSDMEVSEGVGFDVIPTLSGLSPTRRVVGEELTISGSGFGGDRVIGSYTSKVTFDGGDGVDATDYTSWSEDEIVVVVPTGAQTGTVTVVIDDASVGDDKDSVTSSGNVAVVLSAPDLTDLGQL